MRVSALAAALGLGILGGADIGPGVRDMPDMLKAGSDRRGRRGGSKPSSGVQCPGCRVTLSRGECLNRMCKKFIGQ